MTLSIPPDALERVRRVTATRDMWTEALLEFCIGEGLRRDAARLFSERMQTTAEVLARHIDSEEERSAILREIRGEAA